MKWNRIEDKLPEKEMRMGEIIVRRIGGGEFPCAFWINEDGTSTFVNVLFEGYKKKNNYTVGGFILTHWAYINEPEDINKKGDSDV